MTSTETTKEELCGCGQRPKLPPHPCPFRSDVNNDDKTECTCCESCQQECTNDI